MSPAVPSSTDGEQERHRHESDERGQGASRCTDEERGPDFGTRTRASRRPGRRRSTAASSGRAGTTSTIVSTGAVRNSTPRVGPALASGSLLLTAIDDVRRCWNTSPRSIRNSSAASTIWVRSRAMAPRFTAEPQPAGREIQALREIPGQAAAGVSEIDLDPNSNSRQRSGHGHEAGISRPFLPSEPPIAAIQWLFSGLAGIAAIPTEQ